MHEHVPALTDCELLVVRIEGNRKEIRMSNRRFWIIKYALALIIRSRCVPGKQLEKVIGHTTVASLLD